MLKICWEVAVGGGKARREEVGASDQPGKDGEAIAFRWHSLLAAGSLPLFLLMQLID